MGGLGEAIGHAPAKLTSVCRVREKPLIILVVVLTAHASGTRPCVRAW
jgi:hypothetical protein